ASQKHIGSDPTLASGRWTSYHVSQRRHPAGNVSPNAAAWPPNAQRRPRFLLLSAHLVSKFGELRRANKSTVVNRGRDAEEAQKLTLQGWELRDTRRRLPPGLFEC